MNSADDQAVNASNRMRNLARSRSGSFDTLTSSIMSQSASPINGSPEKVGEGSRKSSLNAVSTPPSAKVAGESDEEGYVTAEEEDGDGEGDRTVTALPETVSETRMSPEVPSTATGSATEERSVQMENASSSGIRGLMGRMRL